MPKQERGVFNFIEKGNKTREKENGQDEKAKLLEKHLKEDYSVATTKGRKEVSDFFSKMNSFQIKKLFKEEEFEYFYKAISEWNSFRNLIGKEMPELKEIAEFEKKYGYQNLPSEIKFYKGLSPQTTLLWSLEDRIVKHKPGGIIKIPELENQFALLKREIKEFKERKREEGLAKIIGFEKFDLPKIKGEKIVEKATAIFPRGLISDLNNLKYIEYIDEKGPSDNGEDDPPPSGIYDSDDKKIIIYKKIKNPKKRISLLPVILAHELGHSIDPREIGQKSLSLKEQFELIKRWEEIRKEEPVKISFYCQSIEDEVEKSKDGWAESIRLLLTDPLGLKEKSEKRYNFFLSMLKKSYPEFNPSQNIEKLKEYLKEYNKLLSDLGYDSVNSALRSVETKFEKLKEK